MRRILVFVGVLAAASAGAVVVLYSQFMLAPQANAYPQTCQASVLDVPATDASDGSIPTLDEEQRAIVSRIIAIGREENLPPRAWQIAIQAGMTESGLRNLDYGDRDSLGIFQMRPSMGWGTPEQLQDVDYQIRKFYSVLRGVDGWQTMRPGDAAQAVERSGFPQRYHRWEAMAVALVGSAGKVVDPTGCQHLSSNDDSTSATAQRAIAAARRWLGTPYAWGGGGVNGPGPGMPPDEGVIGFDCSSLMQYAYAQAGVTLPRVSRQQYHAGAHYPIEQAQPGDLVFWADATGNPAAIHHVGLYIGDNKVLHAPQSGDVVKISRIWKHELVRTVARPGVDR